MDTRIPEAHLRAENLELKQRRRPKQARAVSTYEAILIAAAHILDRHGEAAFTTNKVADRAGVSIGSLYQYFKNKQDILVALAEREEGRLRTERPSQEAAIHRTESPLRVGLRSYINMLPENPVARAHALAEISEQRGPAGVAAKIDERCLASGLYEGLNEADQFVLSRAITGVVQSAVREQDPRLHTQAFEDSLVKLVRAFLRVTP